jgi:integrase/recombinase XerD
MYGMKAARANAPAANPATACRPMSDPGFVKDAGRVTLWPIVFQIIDLQADVALKISMERDNSETWLPNSLAKSTDFRCNTIGHSVSGPKGDGQREDGVAGHIGMSLYSRTGARKYLSGAERKRFLHAARQAPPKVRLFCSVLVWGGARISEVLSLTPAALDLDDCVATFETLKRRAPGIMRQVPLPTPLVRQLDHEFGVRSMQADLQSASSRLWKCSRTTAWRWVKGVMRAAGIAGAAAMPKGLRHTFGVAAFDAVPPHIVQRWLGHASLRTTAIYGDVSGREERAFAERIWRNAAGRRR